MHRRARSGAFGVALALGLLCGATPALTQGKNSIGYPSVAAALEALRADRTAMESTQDGWTVFVRIGALEIWSFAPEDHPAYPSAARRTAYPDATGAWHVVTEMLCQSTTASCDALMEEYRQLDEQMKNDIQRRHGGTGT